MKNHIMTTGEVLTARRNLEEIERCYGKSIPAGYLDATRYSDRILTTGEAMTIATNLRELDNRKSHSCKTYRGTGTKLEDIILAALLLFAVAHFLLYGFFGIDLFSMLF